MNVETSNNLIDVPFEENEGSVMDCDEGDAGSVSLNFVDIEDFLEGNEVEEATSISSLLDSVSDTGALNVDMQDVLEGNEEEEATSISSLLDSVSATGAEEVIVVEVDDETMVDVDLVPQAPVSEASTDSSIQLTPLQEYQFKITIDAIRLREERREAEEAFLDEQELSVSQCTGYGIHQGHLVFNRVIEGLLPKIPSMQLTFNWLTNSENNFNISI